MRCGVSKRMKLHVYGAKKERRTKMKEVKEIWGKIFPLIDNLKKKGVKYER